MYAVPSVESLAARVARAKAAVRWATAEALLGREVNGFAQDTWVTAVQHLLLMHALNPDAVALEAEHLTTLYHILTVAVRHSGVLFRTESCSGSELLALEDHRSDNLSAVPVAGSEQAATERAVVEQFWGNISPHWLEFVRTCRVGHGIDFEDFVSWVNDRAVAEGVQDPWAPFTGKHHVTRKDLGSHL